MQAGEKMSRSRMWREMMAQQLLVSPRHGPKRCSYSGTMSSFNQTFHVCSWERRRRHWSSMWTGPWTRHGHEHVRRGTMGVFQSSFPSISRPHRENGNDAHNYATVFQRGVSTATNDNSSEDNNSSNNNQISHTTIQRWSKQKLAHTTHSSSMKGILGDIALRLDRQSQIIEDLKQQIMKVSDFTRNQDDPLTQQTMETIYKNIHNMQVLHRDTARTCCQYYANLPADGPVSVLVCQQIGQACKEIYARHALTIETMAEIVIDIRGILANRTAAGTNPAADDIPVGPMASIQNTVSRFLQARLMTQLLCDHIVDCMMVHSPNAVNRPPKPNGAVSVNVSVTDLVRSAALEAQHLVETNFIPLADHPQAHAQESPEPPHVIVNQSTTTATVVRPWLQYALVELLKNSLASTMERERRVDELSPYYPVLVEVSETETHVQIQLQDQGGGLLPHHGTTNGNHEHLFEFAKRHDKWDRMDDQQTYAMVSSPIRGLGVGLAQSRLHLRVFGGDLILKDRPTNDQLEHGVTVTLLLSKNIDTSEAELM